MEKRFLVDLDAMKDEGIPLSSFHKIEIVEYFLSSVSLMDKIVKEGDKYFSVGVFSHNTRKEIPEDDLLILLLNNLIRPFKIVKKTRYFIPDSAGVISDLDIYERDSLAILKLKSDDSNMFRPYWLGTEVTGDHRYEDDNLSFFGNPINGVTIKGPNNVVYQAKIDTIDIIPVIGTKVTAKGYWHQPTKDQIELIYSGIYKYLIEKIQLLKFQDISNAPLTLDKLLLLFDSKFVFEEDKFEFFSHIIYYILGVIGEIQGSSISWCATDDGDLEKPFLDKGKLDFNCDKFDELIVNPKTPSINIVRYILDFFQNHFLEEYDMMLKLRNPKNNEEQ